MIHHRSIVDQKTTGNSKSLIDRRIDLVTLIAAGFLGLAAITAEARSKILFQSWSFLVASGCLTASCVLPNKRQKTIARSIGIIEVLLTVSITQLAKYSTTFKYIKFIQRDHASLFSEKKHKDFLAQRTEFSALLGRHLVPNKFEHNKDGFREIPAKPEKYQSIINVYGGSTTYDISVTAEQSWPNQLQKILTSNGIEGVKIRNLGIPGGTTAEAIVYSSFNDLENDLQPQCSIHYHGWNDLRNNFVPNLTYSYRNWHLPSMTEAGAIGSHYSTILGLVNLAASKIWTEGQLHHLIKTNGTARAKNPPQTLDNNLRNIYSTNLDTLIALGKRHGGKVLLVPQILNPDKLDKPGRFGWLPNVDDRSVMKLTAELNLISKSKAKEKNVVYANQMTQANFGDDDFTDQGHFSEKGSKKFASILFPSALDCMN